MRASFILQLAILVTLLYILSLNLHYCYSQQVFNETMLNSSLQMRRAWPRVVVVVSG